MSSLAGAVCTVVGIFVILLIWSICKAASTIDADNFEGNAFSKKEIENNAGK